MQTTAQGRTGRPRVQTLDNVVTQAIAVVDEQGAAGLTMSSLARRLGIGTMTLYGYVPSREGLVDLVVARLLKEEPAPPTLTAERWIDTLVDHMGAMRAWALQRPALFHLAKERPRLTADLAEHLHAELEALTRLGFTPQHAGVLHHTLSVQLNGQLEHELRLRPTGTDPAGDTELRGPLAAAVEHLQSADMADVYATGVRAVLVGFAPLLTAS